MEFSIQLYAELGSLQSEIVDQHRTKVWFTNARGAIEGEAKWGHKTDVWPIPVMKRLQHDKQRNNNGSKMDYTMRHKVDLRLRFKESKVVQESRFYILYYNGIGIKGIIWTWVQAVNTDP